MAAEDFDVAALASYLHLTPQQVERLANRGQLPSRRVAGQLRFSRAEIHHWMEERMGLLDDSELAQVEDRLQQGDDQPSFRLTDLLLPEAIAVPLPARTRRSVIQAMAELAASTGLLWDADKMAAAIRAREELQSTAMDNGVALLHPRRPLPNILAQGILALGITGQGIPFGGSRQLTDVFWLICSTDDRSHLRVLARISRLISSESFLSDLRAAPDAASTHQLIQQAEAELQDD